MSSNTIGLNIACFFLVNNLENKLLSEIFTIVLSFPMFFLIYILFNAKDHTKTSTSWLHTRNIAYTSTRLDALEWLEKWLRHFGFSSESDLKVIRRVSFKDGKIQFFDEVYGLIKVTKKKYLMPNWKYRQFWYVTGYAPIKIKEEIPKNFLILMACVPNDYGNKVYDHQFCLVQPIETTTYQSAILTSTQDISSETPQILAVSLGPTDY